MEYFYCTKTSFSTVRWDGDMYHFCVRYFKKNVYCNQFLSFIMFDNLSDISATDPESGGSGPESQPTDRCTAPELAESAHTAGPVQQPDQRPGESTHQDRQP